MILDVKVDMSDHREDVAKALDSAVAAGLEAMGLAGEGHAKQYCPVDTGRLRNSITHALRGRVVYIGTNVEYAPFVELGTVKMAARPFLRPAVQNHIDEYKRLMDDALKRP